MSKHFTYADNIVDWAKDNLGDEGRQLAFLVACGEIKAERLRDHGCSLLISENHWHCGYAGSFYKWENLPIPPNEQAIVLRAIRSILKIYEMEHNDG